MIVLHNAPGACCWITVTESASTRYLELDGCEEGAMDLSSEDPVFHYLWFHRASRLAERVDRALVLGAGAFTAAKCLALDHPRAGIDAVDVESELEPVARQFFRLDNPEFARITFHGVAAEAFLASQPGPYDFILDDLFDGFQHVPQTSRVPEHFRQLRAALKPGGVFVKNLIWDGHAAAVQATCAEAWDAARSAFGTAHLVCLGPEHRGHNRMIVAAEHLSAENLLSRLIAAGIPAEIVSGARVVT